jgi:hypothetical protein
MVSDFKEDPPFPIYCYLRNVSVVDIAPVSEPCK